MSKLDKEAAQRNRAQVDAFLDGIARSERGRKFRDPELAFSRFSSRAREAVDSLKPLEGKALDVVAKRQAAGTLDEEAIPARTFLMFSRLLSGLLPRATGKKDIYALRTVARAAEKLAIDAEDLLAVRDYPHDPPARKAAVLRDVTAAEEIYELLMRTLDNTHREHGVEAPEFPPRPDEPVQKQ